jgi:hypothetical protein
MEQQLYAIKIGDVYNSEVKKRLTQARKVKGVFPAGETLYNKDIVREMDPILNKPKKKQFDEDKVNNKHKINIIEKKETSSTETTSTSSKDDVVNDLKNIEQVDHNLFACREKSRFDFVKEGTNAVEIPKFIKDLIYKKVSRHKLTKNIPKSEDILYTDKTLQGEYLSNNPWAQFLFENKTFNDEWEFIQDFDYINTFVLERCRLK